MEATFCCVQCRLLQAPTTSCVECGTPMVAPVELVRELLYYRDMKMVSGRDWAFITAMIAGGSIAFPVLAPFALGSMVVLGISKLREMRARRVIAGVEMPAPHIAPGARTVVGVARKFRGTVSSIVNDAPVFVEHAMVKDRAGGILIRRSTGTSFLLEREGDPPVLITGVTRLVSPGLFGTAPLSEAVRRGDKRLHRMGVPSDLAIAGKLQVSSVADDDLAIAVTGVMEDESVAELAFHRDGGRVPVMRGQPGAPLLIEDRRLIGAALA
ncbi:MAG TPA: hypothetical protein VLB44_01655 [Kofleriaceae bacterium]|nr:hypothetical protein [Kofleriaceae bacterium]